MTALKEECLGHFTCPEHGESHYTLWRVQMQTDSDVYEHVVRPTPTAHPPVCSTCGGKMTVRL